MKHLLKITAFTGLSLAFSLTLIASGCRTAPETKTENASAPPASVQPAGTPPRVSPISVQTIPIDVPRLAGKSIDELDEVFGAPEEASSIESGGEFRLYRIGGQSKGLAVRFYGKRAKSFNLILDEPVSTSQSALKQIFNIDVGESAPLKDAREPLTDVYRGVFGGVKFKKVSAKKQENGKGYIFVLAEVGE
ncbi:MAG TPA: hypothetical protein VIL74_15395 [Pyrinomonadaceae bacterium]